MSLVEKLTSIKTNLDNAMSDINTALIAKGATEVTSLADVPTAIESVQSGGSGEIGKPYLDMRLIKHWGGFFSTQLIEWSTSNVETRLELLPLIDTSAATDFTGMFQWCSTLTSIPLLDTSNGVTFHTMFYNCSNLTEIPQLDTSNGTSFYRMFHGCKNLTEIPLLDTSNGITFYEMFLGCTSLTEIPLFDTSNATSTYGMFYNCSNLTTIPQLDLSKTDTCYAMFYNCTSLTSVPELNTSNSSNFQGMFQGAGKLTTIPLLDTSNGTNFKTTFYNCNQLKSLRITTVNSDMSTSTFNGCKSLTDMTIGEGFAHSIYLNYSNNLTQESLHGMIENLADLTGNESKYFTIGSTNLAKIDEEHIAMLNTKNWTYS